ncbi:hypothetical protein TRIUR3_34999 [Triticum urartu]|uniref:Uncharacterized protein n=1 Tax=Triticum urartu TaxID=4572 RepID=M8A0X7_TRIUA|nr:hypothetical protein TRIUR3_34999 [Triticum urartu]
MAKQTNSNRRQQGAGQGLSDKDAMGVQQSKGAAGLMGGMNGQKALEIELLSIQSMAVARGGGGGPARSAAWASMVAAKVLRWTWVTVQSGAAEEGGAALAGSVSRHEGLLLVPMSSRVAERRAGPRRGHEVGTRREVRWWRGGDRRGRRHRRGRSRARGLGNARFRRGRGLSGAVDRAARSGDGARWRGKE